MTNRQLRISFAIFLLIGGSLLTTGCNPFGQSRDAAWVAALESQIGELLAQYDLSRQLEHIRYLASDDLEGRMTGSAGERLAADYLMHHLESYGLEPWTAAGLEGFEHSFAATVQGGGQVIGHNIVATLPGLQDDSFFILGAHYDHLGVIDGQIYNGADDNAVSVGLILEIARLIATSGFRPRSTIVFVLFSGEEIGLQGSRALVSHMQEKQLADKSYFLNLEMLGAVGGDWMDVYDQGMGRQTRDLADQVERAMRASGVDVKRWGRDPGSDAHAFADAGIPALTCDWAWSAENHPYYHRPEDTFDKLNHHIIEQSARALIRVSWILAHWR